SGSLQDLLVNTLAATQDDAPPLDAVASALAAAGVLLQERGDFARRRQAIISANVELRERELIKLAALAEALAETLRNRGVPAAVASLTAEAGIAVFRVAFETWVVDPTGRDLPRLITESLDQLKAVTAGN
ncbi:MAG TPA: TetR family transcriptional regulator, partial [Pseudonocardiaceae bacterium]|nr:TetR family transcriptional regulator [Pseudonocardiaceae bacterium]